MKYRYITVLYLFLMILAFNSNRNFFSNNKLNHELIASVAGKIVESGLNYEIKLDKTQKIDENNLMTMIYNEPIWEKDNYKAEEKEKVYKFNKKHIEGYIKIVKNQETNIYISVTESGEPKSIGKIEKKLDEFIKKEKLESDNHKYVKAKCYGKNILSCENAVEKTLKDNMAGNVNRIKINNGYSITAFMGKGPDIKIGDGLVDINCAISKYNTGIYLIIGNPILSTTY